VDSASKIFECCNDCVGEPNRSLTPDLLLRALRIIHASIDRGIPAIVWNLTHCEFGLIYGYDDERLRFTYSDASGFSREVPYECLGRTTRSPELFVAAITHPKGSNGLLLRSMSHVLNTIVTHARGAEPSIEGYTQGLRAYDVWIEALHTGELSAIGHAYNVALLTEAREQAVAYLEALQKEARIYFSSRLCELLASALHQFRSAHRLYLLLYPRFP
jgi:hypothetical protein